MSIQSLAISILTTCLACELLARGVTVNQANASLGTVGPPAEFSSLLIPLDDPKFDERLAKDFFADSFCGTRGNRLVVVLAGATAREIDLFRFPIRATLKINDVEAAAWSGVLRRGGHPITRNGTRRGERTLESDLPLDDELVRYLLEVRDDDTLTATLRIETDLARAGEDRFLRKLALVAQRVKEKINKDRQRLEEVDHGAENAERLKEYLFSRIDRSEQQLEKLRRVYWNGFAETTVDLSNLKPTRK